MALWNIGGGYTFDTDIFLENAANGIGLVLTVGVPATRVGRAIVSGGAKVVGRLGRWAGRNAGNATDAIIAGGNLARTVASNVPRIEDEVIVEVHGQPGASKKALYYLAMAAASGTVKKWTNFVGPTPTVGFLGIEYDAADNWVRCTLKYNFCALEACVLYPGGPAAFYRDAVVYSGPNCSVIGAPLNFLTAASSVGIPTEAQASVLPFAGKTILTQCPQVNGQSIDPNGVLFGVSTDLIPTPNPVPPGDGRSRGNIPIPGGTPTPDGCCAATLGLIPLVYAALANPGSFQKTTFS